MLVKLLSVVCHLLLGLCVTRSVYYRKELCNCGGTGGNFAGQRSSLANKYLEKQLNTFLYKKTVNYNLMLSALEYL